MMRSTGWNWQKQTKKFCLNAKRRNSWNFTPSFLFLYFLFFCILLLLLFGVYCLYKIDPSSNLQNGIHPAFSLLLPLLLLRPFLFFFFTDVSNLYREVTNAGAELAQNRERTKFDRNKMQSQECYTNYCCHQIESVFSFKAPILKSINQRSFCV